MDITWIGHASFQIRTSGLTLLTDPFSPALGLTIPPPLAQADIVTLSNKHPYYNALDLLPGDPTALSGPGEYEISGLNFKGIRNRLHREEESEAPQPEWNTIFLLESEELVFCHLGALSTPLSNRQLEELGNPHVMLVPIGGHGVLNADQAAELVNALEPRIVIPMVYAQSGSKAELDSLGAFLQELGTKEPESQTRLTVTRSNLPAETQVVVLQPAATLL
jgi:L-ascorbate metabolism protein UlaG (beta-lactamase superfamily)